MQSKVSYMAYERGHFAGQAECDLIQESLANDLLKTIQQIQLDAMQEGMRRAAAICVNEELLQPTTDSERNTGIACNCVVTESANNLTLKDL